MIRGKFSKGPLSKRKNLGVGEKNWAGTIEKQGEKKQEKQELSNDIWHAYIQDPNKAYVGVS